MDAGEDAAADDAVTDVEFGDVGECGDGLNIAVVESVAGVELHALFDDFLAGILDFVDFSADLGVGEIAVLLEELCVGTGVDFANFEADVGGGADLGWVGVDEGAGTDILSFELVDNVFEFIGLGDNVEAAFGGDFLTVFWDEHGHLGFGFEGQGYDFVGDCEFEVHLGLDG